MPATLHRLRSKPARLRKEQAAALRQMVLEFPGLPERAVGAIIATVDRETAAQNGWTFVMLYPSQNGPCELAAGPIRAGHIRPSDCGPSCSATCVETRGRSCSAATNWPTS